MLLISILNENLYFNIRTYKSNLYLLLIYNDLKFAFEEKQEESN